MLFKSLRLMGQGNTKENGFSYLPHRDCKFRLGSLPTSPAKARRVGVKPSLGREYLFELAAGAS